MSEVTRIFTVKITGVFEGELEGHISEEITRKFASALKKELDADDVVVTDVQDFVLED